jgi:hypothetical protein
LAIRSGRGCLGYAGGAAVVAGVAVKPCGWKTLKLNLRLLLLLRESREGARDALFDFFLLLTNFFNLILSDQRDSVVPR